eukprot:symbB.v1.2.016213.t1/scaffold1231.1/size130510/6
MKTLQALGLEPPSGHLFHQTSVDFHTLEALQLQQRRLRMAFPEAGAQATVSRNETVETAVVEGLRRH